MPWIFCKNKNLAIRAIWNIKILLINNRIIKIWLLLSYQLAYLIFINVLKIPSWEKWIKSDYKKKIKKVYYCVAFLQHYKKKY